MTGAVMGGPTRNLHGREKRPQTVCVHSMENSDLALGHRLALHSEHRFLRGRCRGRRRHQHPREPVGAGPRRHRGRTRDVHHAGRGCPDAGVPGTDGTA